MPSATAMSTRPRHLARQATSAHSSLAEHHPCSHPYRQNFLGRTCNLSWWHGLDRALLGLCSQRGGRVDVWAVAEESWLRRRLRSLVPLSTHHLRTNRTADMIIPAPHIHAIRRPSHNFRQSGIVLRSTNHIYFMIYVFGSC